MTYTTHYICHYCTDFITTKKFDLVRHLTKQKRCFRVSDISYEEASKLSENKKFYLNKEYIKKLTKEEIQNYVNESIKEGIIINEGEEGKIIIQQDLLKNSNNEKYQVMKVNKDEFHLYFFDEKIQKYKCHECLSDFESKVLVETHILNKLKCDKISKINEAIERAKWKEQYNNYEKIDSIIKKCISNKVDLDHLNFIVDQYIILTNEKTNKNE